MICVKNKHYVQELNLREEINTSIMQYVLTLKQNNTKVLYIIYIIIHNISIVRLNFLKLRVENCYRRANQ